LKKQIILNLIINARDAIKELPEKSKPRVISLTTKSVKPDTRIPAKIQQNVSQYIGIEIKDTGVGMNAEIRNRIFEPFFTTKTVANGTGLGLSTVYGIVQQNRGHILVESAPGQGSVFTVLWPVTPLGKKIRKDIIIF
jgi:signal transduction histidine kinase